MRVRLRPAHSIGKIAELYAVPHAHHRWPDHVLRVHRTIKLGRELFPAPASVADLSCGDGAIARALGARSVILGDLAPGWPVRGPIEETLGLIGRVELFVCCETIEHLDDPDSVLATIRARADALLLSTPLAETTAANPEHYWGWDAEGVREMLTAAGWAQAYERDVIHPLAAYQLWGCR